MNYKVCSTLKDYNIAVCDCYLDYKLEKYKLTSEIAMFPLLVNVEGIPQIHC